MRHLKVPGDRIEMLICKQCFGPLVAISVTGVSAVFLGCAECRIINEDLRVIDIPKDQLEVISEIPNQPKRKVQ